MNKKETLTNKSYIVRYIILKIAMGQFSVGEMIPSENKLAEQLKCARITVHNAYETLKTLGIVQTIKGSGYYVQKQIDSHLNQCFSNLYQISDDFKVSVIKKELEYQDFLMQYIYTFDLIKNKKIIATTYICSKKEIDFSVVDRKDINLSKALVLGGFNDFFNIHLSIKYDNNAFLTNFDSELKTDTPIFINRLYNESNENIFVLFTYIPKKYFNYTQESKLIK